ncbi:MAG TPA: hypothetical protein VGS19_15310 [Streptosporangiaceae bacterium]|nr:hypothetical protein [Streptosporangiaceae bacterium]
MMVFLIGALLGLLLGGMLCVRYLRHEIAADIGPSLRRMRVQLDNLETAINLELATRYAELSERLPRDCGPRDDRGSDT